MLVDSKYCTSNRGHRHRPVCHRQKHERGHLCIKQLYPAGANIAIQRAQHVTAHISHVSFYYHHRVFRCRKFTRCTLRGSIWYYPHKHDLALFFFFSFPHNLSVFPSFVWQTKSKRLIRVHIQHFLDISYISYKLPPLHPSIHQPEQNHKYRIGLFELLLDKPACVFFPSFWSNTHHTVFVCFLPLINQRRHQLELAAGLSVFVSFLTALSVYSLHGFHFNIPI